MYPTYQGLFGYTPSKKVKEFCENKFLCDEWGEDGMICQRALTKSEAKQDGFDRNTIKQYNKCVSSDKEYQKDFMKENVSYDYSTHLSNTAHKRKFALLALVLTIIGIALLLMMVTRNELTPMNTTHPSRVKQKDIYKSQGLKFHDGDIWAWIVGAVICLCTAQGLNLIDWLQGSLRSRDKRVRKIREGKQEIRKNAENYTNQKNRK